MLGAIAAEHVALTQRIAGIAARHPRLAAEVRARRDALVHPGFFKATPWAQLGHLPRYLKALDRRIAKFIENPARDARHSGTVADWWRRYQDWREQSRAAGRSAPDDEAFRWLLEELSVSLFAQELKTPFPVSYKRVERAWADLMRQG